VEDGSGRMVDLWTRQGGMRGTCQSNHQGEGCSLTRPVQKLCPIEVHAGPNAGKRQDRFVADLQGSSRPRRVAALDAVRRICRLANQEND